MSRYGPTALIPSLPPVDRDAGLVGRQLAQHLRDAIAAGALKPGGRLPSTRALALSRGTVVAVFDQLTARANLDVTVGAGTRVASALTDDVPATPAASAPPSDTAPLPLAVSRLAAVARTLVPQPPVPFAVAVPAAGIAPDDGWRRLGNRVRATASDPIVDAVRSYACDAALFPDLASPTGSP